MKFDINDYHRNIQNEDLLKDVIKISERTEKIRSLKLNIKKKVEDSQRILFCVILEVGMKS